MDAVEQANSGHPGTPMALAPVAYLLWTRHLKHSPRHPDWPDRDRFVLSCGHASMLLYGLLHLTGYDLSLDDLRQFRQWGSRTPGHPERGHTAGVETTTGPLGQGIGNAVGMAMAERFLAARFNVGGAPLVDHRTWALASDGDLMEGVASEAASLAGHLRLGKLTVIYDDNSITIDGRTELAFSEDVGARFEAYGWRVLRVDDGNDLAAIDAALSDAAGQEERPTLIVLRTVIADPAPTKRDTPGAHGAPLGAEEIRKTKAILGWPDEPFFVPRGRPRGHGRRVGSRGRRGGELAAEPRGVRDGAPRRGGAVPPVDLRRASRGMGRRAADLRHGRQGGRDPAGVRGGAQGAGRVAPQPGRRLRGPGGQHRHGARAGRRLRPRRGGTDGPLGHPRARHGGVHERHGGARRGPPLRQHLPRVQRLHEAVHPPGGADGAARHLPRHPRLDRRRRGRPDAPAGRAPRHAARHPERGGPPAGRRQRDGRGVARGRPAARRSHGAGAHAAEAPRPRPGRARRRRRGCAAAATCSTTRRAAPRPS